ncbi:MAG: IPT/TIG domain-containing protein [Myxococcales bacterium]|nr:IPT/TIG domain-containing protein [Myxococcales bacterium]
MRTLALTVSLALAALGGCTDDAPAGGPRIDAVRPDPVDPGDRLVIEGEGFGEAGHVALGGRPLVAESWAPSQVTVFVPADQAAGQTLVVVVADGRPSPGAPVEVTGTPRRAPDGGRGFPPRGDAGRDARPPPSDAGPTDARVPDVSVNTALVAEYTSDPAGQGAIRLEARPSPAGELILEVVLPREPASAWGLAFHLAFDRGLMTLVEATPTGSLEAQAKEIGPGRVAAGRLLDGRPTAFRLRFQLLGRGEGRVSFPARYRALRDRQNRPVDAVFTEGSIRVQEVGR